MEVGLSYYSSLASSVRSMTLLCDFWLRWEAGPRFSHPLMRSNAIIVGIISIQHTGELKEEKADK